jgi:putative transposase
MSRYQIATVCQVVDYPRSQVYYRLQAVEDERDLKGAMLTLAGQHPTYGYRRITAMLNRQGQTVNHKRVARLMQELGLMGKLPVKRKRITNSQHAFQRYPNRVMEVEIERPDQVWVGDITYIRLQKDFVYRAQSLG